MSLISNINVSTCCDQSVAKIFWKFVKHHRLEQNITQAKLAEESGINHSTLIEFEKGNTFLVVMTLFCLCEKSTAQIEPFSVFQ